jgi:hypothetical protein
MAIPRPIGVRTLLIIVVAAFSATTAVLLWHGRTAQPGADAAAAHLAAARATTGAGPDTSAATRTLPMQSVSPLAKDRGRSEARDPLPVQLFFHRRMVHDDPRHRGRPSFVMDGRIYNDSSEPLSVEVLVSTPRSQTAGQIMLAVAPHSLRDFGADDGLEMHTQDVITLKSPPFGDLVTQIR